MSNDLLVIVPSRNRAANVARLLGAFRPPCRADLLICQDDDDPAYRSDGEFLALSGPRKSFAGWLNHVVQETDVTDRYRFVGAFGDDHFPRTPGWAERIIEALEEMGPGSMVYADDLYQRERLSTTIFMTSDIPKTLGYFAPEGFYQYCDPSWFAMGRAAECLRYLPGVQIEHLHPAAKKADEDQTYRDSFGHYHDDMAYMEHYRETQLDQDVAKVKALRGL